LYIGIGDEMTRAWGPHNEYAEALLARRGAELLQTPEPFSTRADALKAEAIAIHLAARWPVSVSSSATTLTPGSSLLRPPTAPA